MPSDPTPDKAETIRDWESIQVNPSDRTERLVVQGGWLYRTIIEGADVSPAVALVYVPGNIDFD